MKEKKAEKLAKKYFHWWARWLGMSWQHIDLYFVDYIQHTDFDGNKQMNPDQAGECWSDWRYQESSITLSTKKLCCLTKVEIEKTVLHELMHIFLNEMREEGIDHEERVATNLQKAFFWLRDGVREEK